MTPKRFVPAVAVLVALGVVGGVAVAVQPAPVASPALATRQVAITGAVRACPPGADSGENRIALFAASTSDGAASDGAATDGAATDGAGSNGAAGGQAALSSLTQAGVVATSKVSSNNRNAANTSLTSPATLSLLPVSATSDVSRQQGSSVTATGAMAQGVEAEVAQSSGLATVRCGAPGSDIWFIGPGQQNGASQIELDLMNVDSLAATVDVNVITDAGPAQSAGYSGITVPPHQLVTESLSSVANGSSVVAIEVRTSAGRVAAAVSESASRGSASSWVPSAAAPSTSLIIPGVAPSATLAGLLLVVPGVVDARVGVVAITAQGRYQPLGSQLVDLPGESASYVDLTPPGSTVALKITANVPVTAAVLIPGNGIGAFATAAAPVTEQAVIAGNTTSDGLSAAVVLTAPAAAATVRLTETAEGGASASRLVTVPAGRTVDESVEAPSGSRRGTPFAVVVTPLSGSGPVYAARVETNGQGTIVSIIPAESALTTISLPPVRDSYTAIAP
jgi:Family of unknown function (DUF5719)